MLRLTSVVLFLIAVLVLSSPLPAADWGSLTGKFVYDGTPPAPDPIVVNKDIAVFGKLNLVDESLVVGKDGGIANIVIYVRTRGIDVHPDLEKNTPAMVTFDNKGGRFRPRILPVWLEKQKVLLHNSDPVSHNSNVQPLGDEGANPLLPASGGSHMHTFNRQQFIPVPVSCGIHPWMKGYILPRSNPYVAVTGPDGSFKLDKLPVGELEFQVWQEKSGYVSVNGWVRGRFTRVIKSGANDLGTVKVTPELFNK